MQIISWDQDVVVVPPQQPRTHSFSCQASRDVFLMRGRLLDCLPDGSVESCAVLAGPLILVRGFSPLTTGGRAQLQVQRAKIQSVDDRKHSGVQSSGSTRREKAMSAAKLARVSQTPHILPRPVLHETDDLAPRERFEVDAAHSGTGDRDELQ